MKINNNLHERIIVILCILYRYLNVMLNIVYIRILMIIYVLILNFVINFEHYFLIRF